ncbi:MAG: hypothetical protein EP330_00105 [Deltaproteobacteria bacterium]|nr:MAG: hypothetical protein EP330_00105 [Deltaproteobacteria bacterium]
MAIPEDFAAESLYDESGWFIHDVLEIDREAKRVVALVDTTRLGPLVDSQRSFPGHDKHFPGAVAVQLTATLGCLLCTYVLDMRATEGWVGFGTHIHSAKFPTMGIIGPPVHAAVEIVRHRSMRGTHFIRYRFHYTQEGRDVYVAEHSAAWFQSEHRGPLPG